MELIFNKILENYEEWVFAIVIVGFLNLMIWILIRNRFKRGDDARQRLSGNENIQMANVTGNVTVVQDKSPPQKRGFKIRLVMIGIVILEVSVAAFVINQFILSQSSENQDRHDPEKQATSSLRSDRVVVPINVLIQRQQYTLNLGKLGNGKTNINGTMYDLPKSLTFNEGEQVCIEAFPDSGWPFKGWTGAIDDMRSRVCFGMDGNKSITANFQDYVYANLKIEKHHYGQIEVNGKLHGLPWNESFIQGTDVVIKVSPEEDFVEWSGDVQGSDNPVTIKMDDHKTIRPIFKFSQQWQTVLFATGAGNAVVEYNEHIINGEDAPYVNKYEATIGVGGYADDTPAPPSPLEYSVKLELYNIGDNGEIVWEEKLSKDIREEGQDSYQWIIAINPHGNKMPPTARTAVLSWNPDTFNTSGSYKLKDYDSGNVVVTDMRTIMEHHVSGEDRDILFIIEFMSEPFEGKFRMDIYSVRPGTSGDPLITKQGIVGIIMDDGNEVTAADIETIQRIVTQKWDYPWNLEQSETSSMEGRGNEIVERHEPETEPLRVRADETEYTELTEDRDDISEKRKTKTKPAYLSYLDGSGALYFSPPCSPEIKPVQSRIGYRERNNDKRCEGFYQSPVAAGSIEVVGLVKGKFRFKWDKEEIVEISSPFGDKPVYVCAMGIPIKTFYLMNARIPPGKKLRWPVADVIFPQKLYPKTISIFGWIRSYTEGISYVPIRAVGRKMNSVPEDEKINLYLRTSVDVELVKWRYRSNMTDGLWRGQWKDADKSRYRSGFPIHITLPLSETGELYVEVAAKEKGSARWLKKKLRVLAKEAKSDENG